MANKFTNPQYYTDIANAIRTINGLSRTYTPPQMAQAILDLNISTGEAPELIGLEIVSPPNKTNFAVGDTFDSTGIEVKALYAGGYYRWVSDDVTFSIAEGYIFTRSDVGTMVITVTYVDEWDSIATASFELTTNDTVSFEVRGYFFMDTGSSSSSRYIDFKIYTEYLKSIKIILDVSFKSNYGPLDNSTWNIYGGDNNVTSTTSGTILETFTCTSDSNGTIIYENNNLENSEYDWIGFYHSVGRTHLQADTRAKIICSLRDSRTIKYTFKSYNSSQYITDIYTKPLAFYNVDNIVLTNGRAAYNNYNAYDYYNIYTATDTNTLDFDDNIDWNERDKNSGIELRHDSRNSTYNVDYLFTYKALSNISLSSISIESLPKKLNYYTGDQLDLTGLVVKALYSDGIVQEIGGYITSIANHSILDSSGVKTITISHTEKGITKTASFTINVTQSQYVNGVQIVSWADGTDAQVSAMVTAADQGKINLTNYWHVGDERIVHLDAMEKAEMKYPNNSSTAGYSESHVAQDVQFVLMSADTGVTNVLNPCYNYQYVTPTSSRTHPSFIVGQKNILKDGETMEGGVINLNSNTSAGSWNSSARRTWCNETYRNAIPSSLRSIFKQVKVKTATEYNSSDITESNDYFFLPASKEIVGSGTTYSTTAEADTLSQWSWYETVANRNKLENINNLSDVDRKYWLRSPKGSTNNSFCLVYVPSSADPSISYYYPNYKYGIAPAGCI